MASPQSTLPDNKEDQDSAYNPGEQAYREGIGKGHVSSGLDQLEAFANDPANHDSTADIRKAEENPANTPAGGFYRPSEGGKKKRTTLKGLFKGKGPLTAILALLGGGGGIFAILASPSLLFFHIQENLVNRFDVQNTSMSVRYNKMVANKLSNDMTKGSCSVIKVACRFARPSNVFLDNMEKNGIRALDDKGNPIDRTKGPFPNGKPTSYEFTGKDGVARNITASDFVKEVRTNPELRAALHRTSSARFIGFTDSVFKGIQKRFGFKKTTNVSEANDSKAVKEKINQIGKGAETGAKAASAAGGEAGETLLVKLLKQYATKAAELIKKAGRGSAISLVFGVTCAATNIPDMVIGVTRAYQMAQLVRYSGAFLNTSSALKASAGDLSPEAVGSMGALLTTTVAGKSAMDSFGMKYALFGDTAKESNSYVKYAPGQSAIAALGDINQITSSEVSKATCSVLTNPVTGVSINATLSLLGGATLGTTAAVAAINLGVGFALTSLLDVILPEAINGAVTALAPYFNDILGLLLGDLTADLAGEDVGNALSSGAAHMMGQAANAGGNMPLTVDQAVAYRQVTDEVQLAYAEEDRATLSPFDGTNPNTFLGSMVGNLLPYYSKLGTVSGALKTLANIPSLSLNSLLKPTKASAANVAAEFELCDDPAVKGKVAAGPFCNIEYGVPPEYLNMDTQEVVDALVASGDIDENTGKPKDLPAYDEAVGTVGLKDWMEICTDGTTTQANNCRITDEKTALYAVYSIDYRLQKNMDGMDTVSKAGGIEGLVSPVVAGFSISSGFGPRSCEGCSAWHKGIDIIGSDQVVHSVMDGTVVSVGGDINNTLVIRHADGLLSQYLHMRLSDITVKEGDTVTSNQVIGKMGNEGQSTGTHLHFELKITEVADAALYEEFSKNPSGQFINPAEFFTKNGIEGYS